MCCKSASNFLVSSCRIRHVKYYLTARIYQLCPCLIDVRCEKFDIMRIKYISNVIVKFVNLPVTQLHFSVKVYITYNNVNGRRNCRNSAGCLFLAYHY